MKAPRNPARSAIVRATVLLALGSTVGAQQLTLTPQAASPGQTVIGVLRNDTEATIFYTRSCEVRTLLHSGELFDVSVGYQSPRTVLPLGCDQVVPLAPGAVWDFRFTAPEVPGSYTVITADLERAAARLDVATPSPAAQRVCFYPSGVWLPQTAHEVDFQRPFNTTWEFANTGATAHVFGAGDRIRLFPPGSTAVAASLDLAGFAVPAGKVRTIALPLAGVVPGPYVVEAAFVDADAGPVATRSGIQPRGARVDLHMFGGHALAAGELLDMGIAVTGFSVEGEDPFYFLLVGFQPGTTPLPGGLHAPVVLADPLVAASISSGLGGLLVQHIGRVTNFNPLGVPFFAGGVEGLGMTGPNLPGLSGLVLRVGVLAIDPGVTTWGASQPEEIVLR